MPRPPSGERIMSAQGPWGSQTPVHKQRRPDPYLTPHKPCSRPVVNPKARTKARKPLKTLKRDVVIMAERMTRLNTDSSKPSCVLGINACVTTLTNDYAETSLPDTRDTSDHRHTEDMCYCLLPGKRKSKPRGDPHVTATRMATEVFCL